MIAPQMRLPSAHSSPLRKLSRPSSGPLFPIWPNWISHPTSSSAEFRFSDAAARRLIDNLRKVRVQRPDGTAGLQLGPYIEPVQLQVVCRRLWESLSPGAEEVTEADIDALGDVDTALADYYS